MPLQHDKALGDGTLAQLVEQAALTHACLAGNQDAMAFTPPCSMQSLAKSIELGLSANDYGRDYLGGIGKHARDLTLNTERLSNENSPLLRHANAGWHSAAVNAKVTFQ